MRRKLEREVDAECDESRNPERPFQSRTEAFDPGKKIWVVVMCEDAIAAARASLVLDHIGGNCESDGRIIYRWWTYGDLANALRKIAAMAKRFR